MNKENFLQRNKELFYISNFFTFAALLTNFIFFFFFSENFLKFSLFFIICDVLKIYLSKSFFNSFFEYKKMYLENTTTFILAVLISFLSIFSIYFLDAKKVEINDKKYIDFLEKNTIVKKGEKKDEILISKIDSIYKEKIQQEKIEKENETVKNKINFSLMFLFSEIIFYLCIYFTFKYNSIKKDFLQEKQRNESTKEYQKKYREQRKRGTKKASNKTN